MITLDVHLVDGRDDVVDHRVPYHHLVKQAACERLAVGEERERADIPQRLRDGALVVDEVAAVRPRHQSLGRHTARGGGNQDRRSDVEGTVGIGARADGGKEPG